MIAQSSVVTSGATVRMPAEVPVCLVLFPAVTSDGSLRSGDRRRSLPIGRGRARLPRRRRCRAAGRLPARRSGPAVREQFVMPPDLAVMNAANLCPASRPALETLTRETQGVDRDPSPNNRARLYPEKENTRKALAEFLRVTPDEIIITRNTSESNNLVSSGLDLKAGDEVLVHSDNHPSNLTAWREKGKRFGFAVVEVAQKNPHPGMEYYVDAFTRAITPRTKVLCFTHLSSTVGDLVPARNSAAWRGNAASCRSSTGRKALACSTSISARCSRTSIQAARTSGRAAPASAASSTSTARRSRSCGRASTVPIQVLSDSRERSRALASATRRR